VFERPGEVIELLGAERLVQIQLDVNPVVADEVLEVAQDVDQTAAGEILGLAKSDQSLVTARFDAHANVDPGDLVEAVVRIERLHFFDLTTGRAIRQTEKRTDADLREPSDSCSG
jgi:hypothetical protein